MPKAPEISMLRGVFGTVKNGNSPRNFGNILPRGSPGGRHGTKEEIELKKMSVPDAGIRLT